MDFFTAKSKKCDFCFSSFFNELKNGGASCTALTGW